MASITGNIVYVTRDIERALGKKPEGSYHIITNTSEYAKTLQEKYPDNIWLITSVEPTDNSPKILDTYELLLLPEVKDIISKLTASILVFKNTIHIESLCKERGWNLLNPSAVLSEKIENKVTQVSWLGDLSSLLPPHRISTTQEIIWDKKPFVLQWPHGHTGDGTLLIQSEKDLTTLKEKFAHREARSSDFIKGPMFTVNIVVTDTAIVLGNISYQITGILPFTENLFSTIGNDWSVPHTILTEAQVETILDIGQKVGDKMKESGWKGLFGIDVIHDEERNTIHLIEINARQPASTTFETELQNNIRVHGVDGTTVFEAHFNTLTNIPVTSPLIPINDGAQILQRVTSKITHIDSTKLLGAGYKVIHYSNNKLNADLIRIQSALGIMETHMKFNARGKKIVELLA